MNRVAAVIFTLTAAAWALTALFAPHWWESPAFDRAGIPLWLSASMWGAAAVILGAMWARRPVQLILAVVGLFLYAVPTTLMGTSIVWFTIEQNAVSAIGSAIAWFGLGLGAAYRALVVMQHTPGGTGEPSEH